MGRSLTKLKPADSILPHAHIPSPHRRQWRKSHSDAVEITLKKLAYLASIRLRATVMAANRKTRHNNTVTSLQYGRRAIFVSGGVRFQDGGAVDLGKRGAFCHLLLLLFYVCSCASVLSNMVHIWDYSFIIVQRSVRHSGTFYVRCMSMCVVYSTDYIQQC